MTYNGEPVEKGSIPFALPTAPAPVLARKIVDGRYSATKVRLGKHVAWCEVLRENLAPQSSEEAIRQFEAAKAAGKSTLDHYGQPADYIPEDADGNGETVEVEGGRQSLDFTLKGPPRSG